MDSAIESNQITKRYLSTIALKNLNLEVRVGEIFGFLGQNGAGKTSFMKILLGLTRASSGTVKLFGESLSTKSKSKIGYLPEKVSIPGFLTAKEFLIYCGKLNGLKGNDLNQKIDSTLDLVGLPESKNQKTGGFSKGMIQRLGLAQSILHEPELLLLDEPQSGLDPKGAIDLRNIITTINKKYNTTIFLNSHRLLEAEMICSRVGILQKGSLIAIGNLQELTKSKNQIKIELKEVDPSTKEYLTGIADFISWNSDTICAFQPKADIDSRLIPAKLIEKGAEIIKYEKATESLEEIFLRLIEEK